MLVTIVVVELMTLVGHPSTVSSIGSNPADVGTMDDTYCQVVSVVVEVTLVVMVLVLVAVNIAFVYGCEVTVIVAGSRVSVTVSV